jgi:hypothetical protein
MIWDVGESAPEYALVRQVLLGAGSFGAMLSSLRCIPTAEGGAIFVAMLRFMPLPCVVGGRALYFCGHGAML